MRSGYVRVLQSPFDVDRVRDGDVLVIPVVDPGSAARLELLSGFVAEKGDTLSRGAILCARCARVRRNTGTKRCLDLDERKTGDGPIGVGV